MAGLCPWRLPLRVPPKAVKLLAVAAQTWRPLTTPGGGPPIEPPPADIRQYWRDWMGRDGHPFRSYPENIRSGWATRHRPNVHFARPKRDLPGGMRRIAAFWGGGAEVSIDWGLTGRWAGTLIAAAVAEYEATAERELGAECARWLATGALGAVAGFWLALRRPQSRKICSNSLRKR